MDRDKIIEPAKLLDEGLIVAANVMFFHPLALSLVHVGGGRLVVQDWREEDAAAGYGGIIYGELNPVSGEITDNDGAALPMTQFLSWSNEYLRRRYDNHGWVTQVLCKDQPIITIENNKDSEKIS